MPISYSRMHGSTEQAVEIAESLSNNQLMQAYTDGSLPMFVVFSEMQKRQKRENNKAQPPQMTVAERMIGRPPEAEGVASVEEPQYAARGGVTRASTLTMGAKDIPEADMPTISMRLQQIKDLEDLMGSLGSSKDDGKAKGGPLKLAGGSDDKPINPGPVGYSSPISNKDIARIIMPSLINVESGGNQRAVSGKGATGVAQIMPSTGPEAAKLAGLDWDPARYKNDPKYNEALGHAYLTSMLNRFGDREKAVAAYNAGPGRVSNALLKSQASGRDWRSFLPRETQAYIGKVLGGAQRNLPDRQDPEGADIPGMTFGVDPAFGKGRMAPQYDYMRYSPLLDPSKMQSESSIDKKQQGIAALQAAQDIARMRRGQMGFAEGGPIYLEEGSDGLPISPEQRASFELNEGIRQAQLKEQEDAERKSKEKRDRVGSIFENPALSARRKASSDISESPSDLGYTPTKKKEEEINPDTGKPYTFIEKTKRALDRPSPDLATMIFGTAAERTPQGWAAEEATSPSMFEEPVTPPGWQPPPEKQGGSPRPSGIPSVDKSVGSSPFTGSEPPIGSPARNMAEKGLKALRERDAALGGPDAGGKPMVPGTKPSPKEEADMSFGAVYKQVQDAIGSKVPQELADNMKKHQEALASMKNDKIVDALFAAAKTLAGQRVGQQNFGDAIANAGLAAQEAQKRIYKAEDDMRKYRGDLLKAQDDNNQKAASIAMNRLVHAESDKSAMQRAILQVNKAHETATMQTERYEKMYERQNRADAIRSINAEIIKNTPDPDKVDLQTPEQKRYLEELKRRRDALLSGAEGKTSSPDTGMIPPPPAGFKVK